MKLRAATKRFWVDHFVISAFGQSMAELAGPVECDGSKKTLAVAALELNRIRFELET